MDSSDSSKAPQWTDVEREELRALLGIDGVLKWRPWIRNELDDQLANPGNPSNPSNPGNKYKRFIKGLVETALAMKDNDAGMYGVRAAKPFFFRQVFTALYFSSGTGGKELAPKGYQSLAAAKAACERHHASRMQGNREGQWEW